MGTIRTVVNENTPSISYESATSSLSRSYHHRANQYGREVIAASMKHGVSISTIYKETLRSIRNIFSTLFYIDGDKNLNKVECILGNPERTIAKLFQENNLKLPIISVVQSNSEDDDDRRRYVPQLIVETVWNDDIRRAQRVLSVVPRPVNINYEIVVWSKYNEDMDHIITQIRSSFNPSLDVITPASDLTKAFIVAEEQVGAFDVGDREDRIVRKKFTISVETYIPSPKFLITNTGKIEVFNTEAEVYNK